MFLELTTVAERVLAKEFSLTDLSVLWTIPRENNFGDLSTNVALQAASRLKRSPRDLAEVIRSAVEKVKGVEKAEVAGAGYVNVTLTPEALLFFVKETRIAHMLKVRKGKTLPVIVDYSQPNIAKPLGVHHILSTIIGQALCNLYRHDGTPVVGWNYMGDWGTQFGKLAVAWKTWGTKKKIDTYTLDELLELYVRFHKEAEENPALEEEGREAFRKLEQGDAELQAFWQAVVTVTKASLGDIYKRLHVAFDTDLGESFYQDKMTPVLEEGKKKGVFTVGKENALIVEFPEEKKLPPFLVQKGDGATLYATRDLAQIRYRTETYHPQSILHVVDVAQQLYFQQLFETVKRLGWNVPHLEHIVFGRMRFIDQKMSTRKGTVLKLEHVLDEAVERARDVIHSHRETIQTDDEAELAEIMGVGALVYGILSQNRTKDIVFDWDKMLSFEGNSAPYLQYTHARGCSVLRKAEAGEDAVFPKTVSMLTDHERRLIRTLLQFPEALNDARESHMPHILATYLYQLCQDYNAFYNVDPILTAEGDSRTLRIALTAFSVRVLKTGAEILTLRVPDRM